MEFSSENTWHWEEFWQVSGNADSYESFHNHIEWAPSTNDVSAYRGTSQLRHHWHWLHTINSCEQTSVMFRWYHNMLRDADTCAGTHSRTTFMNRRHNFRYSGPVKFFWHGTLVQILIKTFNVRGQSYFGVSRSVSWFLMPWLLSSS